LNLCSFRSICLMLFWVGDAHVFAKVVFLCTSDISIFLLLVSDAHLLMHKSNVYVHIYFAACCLWTKAMCICIFIFASCWLRPVFSRTFLHPKNKGKHDKNMINIFPQVHWHDTDRT
jgi:hypothetical protein